MVLNSGSLDRRIQIRRYVQTDTDGLGGAIGDWTDYGSAIFARRRDVSDAERVSAGAWDNKLVSRFIIRATAFGRSIARTDRLVHEGVSYEIDGIKEVPGERGFLEVTAQSGGVA
ncbi:phage head-tail adaptor, putative, SPP1 family [Roseivivax marinus]|uniref:phage head closure protein n=1 Tax=Roseivivax marinus TaxID=1379903 RepID=UPI0008CD5354|nr:phage head closure protein [Roseivivax marinus]SEL66449.1 phage head-tail adaptor, putative, SPP1 family [Roseivivax marinus]